MRRLRMFDKTQSVASVAGIDLKIPGYLLRSFKALLHPLIYTKSRYYHFNSTAAPVVMKFRHSDSTALPTSVGFGVHNWKVMLIISAFKL